jgi:hydrophobe/amphiphile efflux-3 (HAE3) family protein
MERFWRGVGLQLGKQWKVVLAVVVVITGVLALGFSRIEFATGQDSYLNPESQAAIDNEIFQDAFGGEAVILLFSMNDGTDVADLFTEANIAEFQRIETELRTIPQVHAVLTPLTSMQWSQAIASGEGNVGTNALISAASRDPDPDGKAVRNADVQLSLARLGEVDERVIGNPIWNDFLLYSNDGFSLKDRTVIPPEDSARTIRPSLVPTFPSQQVAVGAVLITGNASLDDLSIGTERIVEVMSTASFENAELTVTGSPLFLKDINDYLQGGMLTLGAIALLVMAVVLIVMFPVRWRLLPLLTVIVGVVWAFALLGFLGISLSLVTISGLPILIGMGIDFAIQIHNRVEEEVVLDRDPHPISETVSNLAPALVVAVVASVLAFMALRISKVPMIRDFGVLLSIGITVLLVVGIVIPVTVLGAREWMRRTRRRESSLVERIVVRLGSLPSKSVTPIAILSVILIGLGVALESNTKIQSDPIRWVDQSSQAVKDIGRLEDESGFSSTLGILVESNNVLAPEVVGVIHEFLLDAEQRPEIVSTSSLVGTMAKVIQVEGATPLPPSTDDLTGAYAVAPDDVKAALIGGDGTQAQVNLRLAPASLDDRAVLVADLEADLEARLGAVELPEDSVLRVGLTAEEKPIRAVPAGLAVVGVGLLENLKANRANLTYLALAAVGLWLVIRFRSLTRAVLTLVPVTLAVGASSVIVSGLGITLSPMTTVSGPLVIASCAEFSVLITARFLEELQRGLSPRLASDTASARTGRAFFTSAATTVGGFATLIFSPLPLLRDFGVIVTLNVTLALLAALVAMPPLLVFAAERGWLGAHDGTGAVRLAATARGGQLAGAGVGAVVFAVLAVGIYMSADTEDGASAASSYEAVPLPTTTTTTTIPVTTTLAPGETLPPINPDDFGTDRPDGLIGGTIFDLAMTVGVPANQAVCTSEVLLSRFTEDQLLALGIASFTPEAIEPVVQAALDCGIEQPVIDELLELATG